MNKHTPGPWWVAIRNTVLAICCKPTRKGEWPEITFIERFGHPEHGSITGRMRTSEELAANARLIAAAPELLELAKQVRALIRLGAMGGVTIVWQDKLTDVEAAIAKAEGNTP